MPSRLNDVLNGGRAHQHRQFLDEHGGPPLVEGEEVFPALAPAIGDLGQGLVER